jgi:hypothetical protein
MLARQVPERASSIDDGLNTPAAGARRSTLSPEFLHSAGTSARGGAWRLRPPLRFAKLRTIDLSRIGLGDNLMLWTGLYTLLEDGANICEPGCTLHVPNELARLASHVFAKFGLQIMAGPNPAPASPVYSPLPPVTLPQMYRAYFGIDWRMNWVEALDLQKSIPRLGTKQTFKGRLRLLLSEKILYKRRGWRDAEPHYIGYGVWLPVARKFGYLPLQFLAQLKRSLVSLRKEMAAFVDSIEDPSGSEIAKVFDAASDVAIFPCGKAFQSMPPKFCRQLIDANLGRVPKFFIQKDDPWLSQYVETGVAPSNLESIDAMLKVIKSAKVLVTTDSFSSHLAQLLRDDFILVLTRDFRENILHPAANPRIVANHPRCAPCNYHARSDLSVCLAGYTRCLAFESVAFTRELIEAVRATSPDAAA